MRYSDHEACAGGSEMYPTFSLKISKLGHTLESKPWTER